MKTEVLPWNFTDDLEEYGRENHCMAVGIEEMTITYVQPADTNSSSDEVQHITITTREACAVGKNDGEDGFYFDVTIPDGEHWSVTDGDELAALIYDFKKRLYQKNGKDYGTEKKRGTTGD